MAVAKKAPSARAGAVAPADGKHGTVPAGAPKVTATAAPKAVPPATPDEGPLEPAAPASAPPAAGQGSPSEQAHGDEEPPMPDKIGFDSGDPDIGIDPSVGIWLMTAKAVLLAEGFKRDLKQFRKPGQVWGVIRQEPDDMQIHVRAFDDGRLESEVELSNKFVQHLWSHRRNAHAEVSEILARNGMPTQHVSETFVPITGSKPDKVMPKKRTKNHHAALTVAVGIGLLLGRHYLKRVILRGVTGRK